MRFSWLASALLVLSFSSIFPARSAAYCRTTTEETVVSGCPEICQTEGLPLYWPRRELHYALNERGFPDLSEQQARNILERSFDTWTALECEGEPIDLVLDLRADSTVLEAGPRELEPNENAIAHIDASDWDDEPRAFAITKIWYNKNNGHILGADMLFNGNMDPFGICPEGRGCTDDSVTDLRNVITHEAGHFLGLAHSDVESSTMWCDAAPGDVDKRELGSDDIQGICSIYGPSASPGPAPSRSKNGTGGILCNVQPGSSSFPLFWGAALAGLGALLVRRRVLGRRASLG